MPWPPTLVAGPGTQKCRGLPVVTELVGFVPVHLSAACGLGELYRSPESGMDKVHTEWGIKGTGSPGTPRG